MKRARQKLYLKQWRTYRGLTQERLAERVGMTQGMISHLEKGRADYSGDTLAKLGDALSCEPQDLLMRDPTKPDAVWSILDNLKKATPEERDQVARIAEALLRKTG